MTIIVAHAVAKTSLSLIAPVVSVDFYVGNETTHIKSFRVNFDVPLSIDSQDPPAGFDADHWKNFWLAQNLRDIIKCRKDPKKPEEGWKMINEFIDETEEKYRDCIFVCDDPSCDTAILNYNLEKYCGRKSLSYTERGRRTILGVPLKDLTMDAEKVYTTYIKKDKPNNSSVTSIVDRLNTIDDDTDDAKEEPQIFEDTETYDKFARRILNDNGDDLTNVPRGILTVNDIHIPDDMRVLTINEIDNDNDEMLDLFDAMSRTRTANIQASTVSM